MEPDPDTRRSRTRTRVLLGAAFAVPLVAAVWFVVLYSTATPLTDEWAFVKSVIDLRDVDLASPGAFASILHKGSWQFSDHWTVVPFLLYWLLSIPLHFDSRIFIYVTLATFLLQIALYRRMLGWSLAATIPIAVLMFSPSHYMEMLWGFEFTLAFSILLPMLGLALLDRIEPGDRWPSNCRRLAGGILLVLLGTLSSSGGFFGFAAAGLLLFLKPFAPRLKLALIVPFALSAAAAYFGLMRSFGHSISFGAREVYVVLTALGGTIWGTPVGLFEFQPDLLSGTGAVILAGLAAAALRAFRIGRLAQIALPLSFAVFGLLSLTAIAVSRDFLGNWHLQYALPVVCGAFACTYLVWREDGRSPFAVLPFAAVSATLVLSLAGFVRGFDEYGPAYHSYIRTIENYAVRILEEPDLPAPFPDGLPLEPDVVLYLSALHHPLFGSEATPRIAGEATRDQRVFVGTEELQPPYEVTGPVGRRLRFTVALPPSTSASGLLLRVGDVSIVMRRIHARYVDLPDRPDATFFAGMLLPGQLGEGAQPVSVWVTE